MVQRVVDTRKHINVGKSEKVEEPETDEYEKQHVNVQMLKHDFIHSK